MQSIGLGYALEPWLQDCYAGRPEELRRAMARHVEYFNTQSTMASLVAGMVCALELEAARAPEDRREDALARLGVLKNAAASALAGVGDALFWAALRPFCAALSLALLSLLAALGLDWPKAAAAAALVYLASFNGPVLVLRWKGIRWGFEWGEGLPLKLKDFGWQRWIRGLRVAGLVLTAAALGAWNGPYAAVAALALAGALAAVPARISAARLYAAACAGFVLWCAAAGK